MMTWMTTHTGRSFDYLSFTPEDIHMEDFFHALANTCRFSGQCKQFYSVAQHSVVVASMLPSLLGVYGLLHDGSEGYMSDLTSPLKALCPEYKRIEKRVQDAIYFKYVGGPPLGELNRFVRQADLRALRWEARELLPGGGEDWTVWGDNPPWIPDDELITWTPKQAEIELWQAWEEANGA